jgi:predicted nucleotide-binding protein
LSSDIESTKEILNDIISELETNTVPSNQAFEQAIKHAKSRKEYDSWLKLNLLYNGLRCLGIILPEYLKYKSSEGIDVISENPADPIIKWITLLRGENYVKISFMEINSALNETSDAKKREILANIITHTKEFLLGYLIKIQNELAIQCPKSSKKIFIIHGHDIGARDELKQLLMSDGFGLDGIILSEQANTGLTIIEKLERDINECGYAFSIITPDDTITTDEKRYSQPRPNVFFETGWVIGKNGRHNQICILVKKGVEMPDIFTDISGVGRIEFEHHIDEVKELIKEELQRGGILPI